MPGLGKACAVAASIKSLRPQRMPLSLGPQMALPPLKMTRSAPSFKNARRLETGGSSAAASTITGTPCAWARAATSLSSAVGCGSSAMCSTAAVCSLRAASISASAVSCGLPTSTIRAPAMRTAWSKLMRCCFCIITSALKSRVSGSCCIRWRSVPVRQAAVARMRPPVVPVVTRPASAPV